MKWEEFLTHPEIAKYSGDESPSKYLFLKTLHEIIAGLNGYRGWVITIVKYSTGNNILGNNQDWFSQWDIVAKTWPPSSLKEIPDDVQDWVAHWNPFVEKWLSNLIPLRQRYGTETADNIDWPALIGILATIPTGASLQYSEAQVLTLPEDKVTKHFVTGITASVSQVVYICNCIQNKEYITLWKYPHSEES
ncbi:MAG: hypothetical protein GY797_35260 [Deltaproteobacteria bacterium]|nr:hypothetical protein [Deltaproteobacteria bacterium]